jgi:hypothetical protein
MKNGLQMTMVIPYQTGMETTFKYNQINILKRRKS